MRWIVIVGMAGLLLTLLSPGAGVWPVLAVWTAAEAPPFGGTAITGTFAPPEGFAPITGIVLEWTHQGPEEVHGHATVSLAVPDQPSPTTQVFAFTLPREGKGRVTALAVDQTLWVPKKALIGVCALARAHRDTALDNLLTDAVDTREAWETARYAWQESVVEIRLLQAQATRPPFRVYVLPQAAFSWDVKAALDGYFLAYYAVAAARAIGDPAAQQTLEALAVRILSPETVQRFQTRPRAHHP